MLALLLWALMGTFPVHAQKEVYIPQQTLRDEGYSETDENQTWCRVRSRESDNIIVFWNKGYGNLDPNSPEVPEAYRVDIDDMLAKLELFYTMYTETLGFADLGKGVSNLDKYKMVICLYYTTDWMAYGSGFDNVIGGMWVSPSTCHPVGSTIAHELGHSFQYQVYCDNGGLTGFRDGCAGAYWEQTAQWMATVNHPDEIFNHNFIAFQDNHHRAFHHEWQRYGSYFMHYYQTEKHGMDIIGRVWRQEAARDISPCEVYATYTGIDADGFYVEVYDMAAKFATWDLDCLREYGKEHIGTMKYDYVDLGGGKYQVAYSSCPSATGFNLIPLQVPENGGEVTAVFTALRKTSKLADGDPGIYRNDGVEAPLPERYYNSTSLGGERGFRHGYVALLRSGERVYHSIDTIYGRGNRVVSDTTTFTVPADAERLWFVVSPSPTKFVAPNWDENERTDDQWPYQVQFSGTDILGHIDLGDPSEEIHDTIIHYHVGITPDSEGYTGVSVTIEGEEAEALARALKIQPAELKNLMADWTARQPDNSIVLYPLNPTTLAVLNSASTANGYGHWFARDGQLASWPNGTVFSEFNVQNLTFFIGQHPGKLALGDEVTFAQGLRLRRDTRTATVRIVFHVYGGDVPSHIDDLPAALHPTSGTIYDLAGRPITTPTAAGIYIVDGRKMIIRK